MPVPGPGSQSAPIPPPRSTPSAVPPASSASQQQSQRDTNKIIVEVVPWLASLLFHLAMIILAFFMVWATITSSDDKDIIIPIATLGETPGAPLSMNTPQQLTETASARRTVRQTLVRSSTVIDTDNPTLANEIGIAGSVEAMASPFAADGRPGDGFDIGFFGSGGNARSIVFVIDASGSMIDTMPFVIDELKRTIAQLNEQQRFNVIFFQGGRAFEVIVPRRGMKQATSEAKQRVIEWIDLSAGNVVPGGQTDPTEAIQMALRLEPELAYILSDNIIGSGPYGLDPDALIQTVRQHNQKPSKINTIQFYHPDPLTAFGRKATLQQISEDSGGIYKFVSGRDLYRR